MEFEFQKRIVTAVESVFGGTPIFLAYAYGSRVQGVPMAQSDLDIGYYVCPDKPRISLPFAEEMRLADRLSRRLGLDVDLRHLGEAPLELQGRALEQGVRVYCSDSVARVNLERTLLGMYHDYKEEFAAFHALRLRAVAASGG